MGYELTINPGKQSGKSHAAEGTGTEHHSLIYTVDAHQLFGLG